jgi:hypothetical protein
MALLLMQCVCGFATAFGSGGGEPKAVASKSTLFIRTIFRFCRYNTLKNYTDAATQSLFRTALERRRQNLVRANFA